MGMKKEKQRAFEVDRDERKQRRSALRRIKHTHAMRHEDGRVVENKTDTVTSIEHAEGRQLVTEMARAFVEALEFYKSEQYGSLSHDEAVKAAMSLNEWRQSCVEGLQPDKISWGNIAAAAEVSMDDALRLWTRIREAADDELESGNRAAKVVGDSAEPYARAQFLAIRDAFADQWQPQGGIEAAMIDMLTVSFSLQMYWSTIAHQRALHEHDEQKKDLNRYGTKGWKSPYQYVGDAIDQAYRLADGYNRQFLRVLRQLRDLRRYAPVVIQNNGGQVNVATDGGQQVNVNK